MSEHTPEYVAPCDIACDDDCESVCHAVHYVLWKKPHPDYACQASVIPSEVTP